MNKCIDCSKVIYRYSKRCSKCANSGKNNGMLGKKFSDERKLKMSKATKGKNNSFYGKHHTNETKMKMKLNHITKYGKDNPSWKGGLPKCLDCNKQLSAYTSKRCLSCDRRQRYINPRYHPMFGKPASHSKWSEYKKIKFRSSWESKYAKYLDKNKIKWKYEYRTFDLGNTTYTPDFYLPKTNEYIEIKGYWRDDARSKYLKFRRRYSTIKIKVLNKIKLTKLNVIQK